MCKKALYLHKIPIMIKRKALDYLLEWKQKDDRKPLVLRGARQVGKTTLVENFSKHYDVFLKLNLEKAGDSELFEKYQNLSDLIKAIYLQNKKTIQDSPTLLFIDEIQNNPTAISKLRYFYEEMPNIHVIVAGSLLESILNFKKISFPVGRVEYYPLRPCSFLEFLDGLGETFDKQLVENLEADFVHDRIMRLFREYILVGGMPEVIMHYTQKRDILSLSKVYQGLIASYMDDAEKYADGDTEMKVIRHCLKTGWISAAETITFENFAGSNFKSREVGNALRTLQKAFLLELAYPIGNATIPALPNYQKRPKLFWLDTGLVNYVSKIQTDVFSISDISELWRGRIAEHIVSQELICLENSVLAERFYWRRDVKGSDAEVDFIYPYKSKLIPIEVKSGHNSKLKSLHAFMEEAPHDFAIRIWQNKMSLDEITTKSGKKIRLLNLPFYYVCVLEEILKKYI